MNGDHDTVHGMHILSHVDLTVPSETHELISGSNSLCPVDEGHDVPPDDIRSMHVNDVE